MTGLSYEFLPWQQAIAQRWLSAQERFSHAWLIHGQPGIGKQQFTLAAARSLLCETPKHGLACGQCSACRWVSAGNHPDLRYVCPDALSNPDASSPSKEIRVEQLRALGDWLHTTTHAGGWRVAVIYPADALNPISANALLKVLEEPSANTVFLLVATAVDQLLPTIVSRCRRLPLPLPDFNLATQWLAQQGIEQPAAWLAAASGGPLTAQSLAQQQEQPYPAWLQALVAQLETSSQGGISISTIASEVEKLAPADWLMTLQRLFIDLTLLKHGQAPRYYPDLPGLPTVAKRCVAEKLAHMSKWLVSQQRVANHPLNTQLRSHHILNKAIAACANN